MPNPNVQKGNYQIAHVGELIRIEEGEAFTFYGICGKLKRSEVMGLRVDYFSDKSKPKYLCSERLSQNGGALHVQGSTIEAIPALEGGFWLRKFDSLHPENNIPLVNQN